MIDADTKEFWDACRERRLTVQQCATCDKYRFAPAPICYHCHSFETRSVESSGRGEVYTWTIVHHSVDAATDDHVPYNVVVVRLDDCGNALITSNLVDVAPDDIYAGLRVEVTWDVISSDIVLPRFRRQGAG